MRKILLAILLSLLPAYADAQLYLPQGVGLPPQSVIGNPMAQAGDAVAVPFSQLRAMVGVPAQSCGSSLWVSSISATGLFGCTQPSVANLSGFGAGVAAALSTNIGTAGAPVLLNGPGGTPSSITLTNGTGLPISSVSGFGTGVAGALGVNTGSTGSITLFNGALGTPISGTGTNLTGIPISTGLIGTGTGVLAALGNTLNASGGLVGFTGAFGNIAPTPTRAGDIVYWNGSGWVTLAGNNSGTQILQETSSGTPSWVNPPASSSLTEAQGRLTLAANTPVMTATSCSGSPCAAQTTLRYDCYIGSQVPYYTGSADVLDTVSSCEVTDAMVSAASAGQVVSGQVYDVWWEGNTHHNICLAMSSSTGGGGGWASDTGGTSTGRGTGYSQLDLVTRPYITNKNAIANCFNAATNYGSIAANKATYLGTVYASANGQITYSFGGSASGGSAGILGVWNRYNRVTVLGAVTDSGASYTYSGGSVRQARASAGNQITFVMGQAEDAVIGMDGSRIQTAAVTSATGLWGIGLDTTAAFSCTATLGSASSSVAYTAAATNICPLAPQIGLHVVSANEQGDGGNANTFDQISTNLLSLSVRQ